jgi:hypothetical protein
VNVASLRTIKVFYQAEPVPVASRCAYGDHVQPGFSLQFFFDLPGRPNRNQMAMERVRTLDRWG